MNDEEVTTFDRWIEKWTKTAICSFFLLFFVPAPYGKLRKKSFGRAIDGSKCWIVQELFSPVSFLFFYLRSSENFFTFGEDKAFVGIDDGRYQGGKFVAWWFVLHYFHRAIAWPMRRSLSDSNVPVFASAVCFNVFNGLFVGSELRKFGSRNSLRSLKFVFGIALACVGAFINIYSDELLLRQRNNKNKKNKYVLPSGFLFDFSLSANFLGEFIEWLGIALATGNKSLLVFALWTFANLYPRSLAYKNFYVDTFGIDKVRRRNAFFPFKIVRSS